MNKKIVLGAVFLCAMVMMTPFAASASYYEGTLSANSYNNSNVTPVTYNAGWVGGNGMYYPTTGLAYYNWSANHFTTPIQTASTYPNYTYPNTYPSYNYNYNIGYNYNAGYNYTTANTYTNQTPTYRPCACPTGYINYGGSWGCVPVSYLHYCRYNTHVCPFTLK